MNGSLNTCSCVWLFDIHPPQPFHLHSLTVLLVSGKAILFLPLVAVGISTVNGMLAFIEFDNDNTTTTCTTTTTNNNSNNDDNNND